MVAGVGVRWKGRWSKVLTGWDLFKTGVMDLDVGLGV